MDTKSMSTSKLDDEQSKSKIKIAFVNLTEGIDFDMTTDLTEELGLDLEDVCGNKSEVSNWKGPIPINDYPINLDPDPIVIKKEVKKKFECNRKVIVKYLEPTTELGQPGNIIVNQEANIRPPEAPPIVIYQVPELAPTPEPLVIREKPPTPPPIPPQTIITIPGKILPTPPRTIIFETVVNHPCIYCDKLRASQNLKECLLKNLNMNKTPLSLNDLKARFSYMTMNDLNVKSKFFSKSNFSIGNFSYGNMSNLMTPMKNSLRSSAANNF